MKIEKYISGLLYRYQCVSIPGFGAFLSEWQSAQIAEGHNSFVPPRKVISFNSNIKTNDGLLANHIALQEKISYESALAKIQTQVVFWLEKLQNKEVLTLENIGEVFSNSENNLVFKPNTSVNYLMDSFGLSGFNSPEIIRENQTQNTTETISIAPEVLENEILEEVIIEDETPVIPLVQSKPNTNWLKYAAAAVIVLSTAGTYGYKMYYDYTIDQKTILVEKSVQEKVNQKLQEATFVLPNPMEAVDLTLEEKPNAKYHVVAGAYRSEQNANKALKQLVSQGFDAHILTKNKYGLIPVAFGSYSSLKEAQNFKHNIKEKDSIDAWLLID
ncbi:HU domain-containing protein [Flavobacterium terrigena]|uniref:Sporulation related domain-containing protein n=1 Tax=Flavobacterium terrigena TaxID=402734 RepID=A0A1H6TJV4_9FLAO|nr:SPOR domain-containing protein [Flavobacterium terrigena]SEI80353.1 Sporulation related domain-containing protein [Flavobacterium terrigena]